MGGGGGGGYFRKRSDPEDLSKKLKDSKLSTDRSELDSQVAGLIASGLVDYNDRDVDAVNLHLDAIKKTLERDVEGTIDLRFGGSVAKHTYVDGISDIDSLVLLDKSDLKDKSPKQVKDYFYDCLKKRFPDTEIKMGNLAVTLKFSDAEIQLLPALKYRDGFKISDSSGKNWSNIQPAKFAGELSDINQKTGGRLVPTIKLAKAMIDKQPPNRRLASYHLETLATTIFSNYTGPITPKAMLRHFFGAASTEVLKPIRDKSGQSIYVDSYLGKKESMERQLISDSFKRICRKMDNADIAQSVEQWRDILNL